MTRTSNAAKARHILHVDMDAFYASVEQRDHPEYRGRPVIVGGTGRRGVVSAASYEARRFGVHSAMPGGRARALCPDGIFLPPRMAHYQAESRRIFQVFHRYTPLVEALSLDEAFLDVTGSLALYGSAVDIARGLKQAIREEIGLVASVGVAPNKFLAKLASDQDKPDGLFVVDTDRIQSFLDPLPVRRVWGIGRKAEERLETIGVHTVRQLRLSDPRRLKQTLGNQVTHFLNLAHGRDERAVIPVHEDKSISNEVTLDEDLRQERDCQAVLLRLAGRVGQRARAKHIGGRTITVKVRNRAFKTYTRSKTLPLPVNDDRTLYREACTLFGHWWRTLGPAPIRLLGVGISKLEPAAVEQGVAPAAGKLDAVADQVRARFGDQALRPATLVHPEEKERDNAGEDPA